MSIDTAGAGRVPLIGAVLIATVFAAACSKTGEARQATTPVVISVTSGRYTTTVRTGRVTTVPFAETVIVQAAFEQPVYGAAGQTAVYATASPSAYRIEPRAPRNTRTFTFALTNRAPGTVDVSIHENRDARPVTFTLQVGE